MNYDEMPNYDEEAVQPMRDELIRVGFQEMRTADAVDDVWREPQGTAIVVINSVCGCAAGGARPGVSLALQNTRIPDRLLTVFAGQDKGAVRKLRERLAGFPPSSPFIAVLKDGEPVHVMQRTDIEGKDAQRVAAELKQAFDAHCARPGPSVSPEEFAKLDSVKACGSTIPPATVQIQGLGGGGHPSGQQQGGAPEGREERKGGWWKRSRS